MVALDAIKFHILRNPACLEDRKWKLKVFEKLLALLRDCEIKRCVKVKVVEVVATLIYKGHLYGLDAVSKDSLTRIVLDQLNELGGLDEKSVDIADALS